MAKYIAEENLRPIVYGFVSEDYESEFGLLRGHYLEDDSEYEDKYVRQMQNGTDTPEND